METRKLGNLERQLLAWAQMRQQRVVKTGDLVGPLGISEKQERELFSRMSKSGLIVKVRRGLYLVPARLPLGTRWTPDTALALNTLIADRVGRYQVCGPNAFNRYGYSDQLPQRTYAYNNRISGERRIGVVHLVLIEVGDERLGDTETQRSAEDGELVYSSRVRTLVDAVYDWSRFNGLPRAYDWIRSDLEARLVTPAELARVTLRYGNATTIRRIGALLEMEGAGKRLLDRLAGAFPRPRTIIPWVPRGGATGEVLSRWGIRVNEGG